MSEALGVSGSLKDVSVADVMQFIYLGKRTGLLRLSRGETRAAIGFQAGKIVSAEAPGTPRLGDLLVSRGLIEAMHLEAALLVQKRSPARRTLGQILASSGRIKPDVLRVVVEDQIKLAVNELLTWDSGDFEFALGERAGTGDVVLHPSDVLPVAEVNTQMVLLEASRIFDERARKGETEAAGAEEREATPAPPSEPATATQNQHFVLTAKELHDALQGLEPGGPRAAGDLLELQVVSPDEGLANRLATTLKHELAQVRKVLPEHAGEAVMGAPLPLVLVDLRRGRLGASVVAAIHDTHPRASLIAVVEPGGQVAEAYEAGALATVPPDLEALKACIANIISNRRDVVRGRSGPEPESGLERLRRLFGDLRSGMMSATMALNLMHVISESVERAVLFLVNRQQLASLGAFGRDRQGRMLAMVSRGLRLTLDGDHALAVAVRTGQISSLSFEDANLPDPLKTLLGRPRTGQVAVFPLLGAQGVIAVVYADNGDSEEPIQDLDILELATTQAGVALENEFLRRQISARKD
ncbi:MAG: DUF4388 domain-containing protein [Acidobacteriota bacterium]